MFMLTPTSQHRAPRGRQSERSPLEMSRHLSGTFETGSRKEGQLFVNTRMSSNDKVNTRSKRTDNDLPSQSGGSDQGSVGNILIRKE